MSGVSPSIIIYLFRQDFSLYPKLAIFVMPVCQDVPRIHLYPLVPTHPSMLGHKMHITGPSLHGCQGSKLKSTCLQSKPLYPLSHLPITPRAPSFWHSISLWLRLTSKSLSSLGLDLNLQSCCIGVLKAGVASLCNHTHLRQIFLTPFLRICH